MSTVFIGIQTGSATSTVFIGIQTGSDTRRQYLLERTAGNWEIIPTSHDKFKTNNVQTILAGSSQIFTGEPVSENERIYRGLSKAFNFDTCVFVYAMINTIYSSPPPHIYRCSGREL